jgi:hypothetical protein
VTPPLVKRGGEGRSGVQTSQCGNVVEDKRRVVMLRDDPLENCNKGIAMKPWVSFVGQDGGC